MLGGLLKKFPSGYTPNSAQVKLLKNIDQAFDDGYKFVVCNAPTGSGEFVRVVGYAIDEDPKATELFIYFNPDSTWVEIT